MTPGCGVVGCSPSPSVYVGLTPDEVHLLGSTVGVMIGGSLLAVIVLVAVLLTFMLAVATRR